MASRSVLTRTAMEGTCPENIQTTGDSCVLIQIATALANAVEVKPGPSHGREGGGRGRHLRGLLGSLLGAWGREEAHASRGGKDQFWILKCILKLLGVLNKGVKWSIYILIRFLWLVEGLYIKIPFSVFW